MKKITGKQLDIMKVLWDSDVPFTASGITETDPELNINTVNVGIRQLIDKDYIKIADIVYI